MVTRPGSDRLRRDDAGAERCEGVGLDAVGVEVVQREEQHFAADEDRGDAEVEVVVGEGGAGFHGAAGGEYAEDERLQRAEEDDAFDRDELGQDVVFSELGP